MENEKVQFVQGDILFAIKEEKKDDLKKKYDNVIRNGEHTGHKHIVAEGTLLEKNGVLYLSDNAKIEHDSHFGQKVVVPKNKVAVIGIAEEYDPFEKKIREQAD